jgi:hypothetical protein
MSIPVAIAATVSLPGGGLEPEALGASTAPQVELDPGVGLVAGLGEGEGAVGIVHDHVLVLAGDAGHGDLEDLAGRSCTFGAHSSVDHDRGVDGALADDGRLVVGDGHGKYAGGHRPRTGGAKCGYIVFRRLERVIGIIGYVGFLGSLCTARDDGSQQSESDGADEGFHLVSFCRVAA